MSSDREDRIERLKQQIREVVGDEPFFCSIPACPPEAEESFLERVLRFEQASRQPLRERLADAGIVLTDPDELADKDLTQQMWDAIQALVTLHIIPINTDHLSDRLEQLPYGGLSDRLRMPRHNRTTHVIFEPLELLARIHKTPLTKLILSSSSTVRTTCIADLPSNYFAGGRVTGRIFALYPGPTCAMVAPGSCGPPYGRVTVTTKVLSSFISAVQI